MSQRLHLKPVFSGCSPSPVFGDEAGWVARRIEQAPNASGIGMKSYPTENLRNGALVGPVVLADTLPGPFLVPVQ